MSHPQFNLTIIEFLANHRTPLITQFCHTVSDLGSFDVYILIVTLIYVVWNKRLAIRLSVLLIFTAALNGALKMIIMNPRPFVHEGTYLKKWAISADSAKDLATDYSTPSGHAMSAASFYSYLFASIRNRYCRILAVVAIVLIGLARPYLGVHYLEDILLGWAIGLCCALAFYRYYSAVSARWNKLSFLMQVEIAVAASLALWLLAIALDEGRVGDRAYVFLTDAGFLTGIIIARRLEMQIVNFNPRSSHLVIRILRFLFTGVLVLGTQAILDNFFGSISARFPIFGFILAYLRFAVLGVVCIFIAPLLFTRMGWAKSAPANTN